jgi:O-antigen ligase
MLRVNSEIAEHPVWFKPPRGGFGDVGLGLNWFAAAAFVSGVASARIVNVIGEVYVGELLLIQFAFLLLLLGGIRPLLALPAFGVFVQTAVLMLLGYMLSDIYRDAHPAQFLRGWARIILVTLDFVALAAIVAHDKRNLWWFVLGLALGSIGQLLVRGVPIMSPAGWKFGYSTPLVSLLACLSCFVPIRLACVAFVALGVWNIFMDFRILGAICVLVAAMLWVRSEGTTRLSGQQMLRSLMVCMIAGSIVTGAMLATQDEFSKRREQSNAGREAGLTVAAWAIMESPIIGYGSWPMDARLVNLYRQEMEEEGQLTPEGARTGIFAAHSQVLQAWVEGGALGVLFWLYYGYWLLRSGWYAALHRPADAFSPIYLFFVVYDFWHLLMSPFSGPTRIPIALGVAIICACAAERQAARVRACGTGSLH